MAASDRQNQAPQPELLSSTAGRPQLMRMSSASPSQFDPRYYSQRARELQSQDASYWPQITHGSSLLPQNHDRDMMFDSVNIGNDLASNHHPFDSSLSPRGLDVSSSASAFGPNYRQRARAGTLPSRLSSSAIGNSQFLNPLESTVFSKSALPTTVPSPLPSSYNIHHESLDSNFRLPTSLQSYNGSSNTPANNFESAQSRYRSGSLNLPTPRPSLYTSFASPAFPQHSWNDSSSPLSPNMPALSTLDYLGLEDSPQPSPITSTGSRLVQDSSDVNGRRMSALSNNSVGSSATPSYLSDMARLRTDVNRLRSYSVNASERYDDIQNGGTLEGLLEEQDGHHDFDQISQLGRHYVAGSRPRSRTTVGPELQSRIKSYTQVLPRVDYAQTMEQSSSSLSSGDISTADESTIVNSLDDQTVGPTRALWIGNLPAVATISFLTSVFSPFGPVESTRILSNKACGFVNYASVESAIQAKAALNGTEVFPGLGALRIGYAKVVTPTLIEASPNDNAYTIKDTVKLDKLMSMPARTLRDMDYDIINIVKEYGADSQELIQTQSTLASAISFTNFIDELPPLPDPSPNRVYDAPKLREIRKRIDNASCSAVEIENCAMDMLDELVELSSDYLGNTVVQKLFDNCSEEVKTKMLMRLSPYLAQLGMHKNGTWAAQKVIDVARTPPQMKIIADSLRPYTVHLFLDQFGNYVLQCCLRFNAPYNDFIFETMLSRFWDIAQGRFGARAMRACLESHYANKEQQRVLAAAITLHSVQLATNANGALLLTWFLDTCTLPNRHRILAPRLIPYLVSLCTHKLASLTVLKVVNNRAEPEARRAIFDALFNSPNDSVLEEILNDSAQGPLVIYKILTTPFLEVDIRQQAVSTVQNVLVQFKFHPSQGYRRLMDEVGLSTRTNGMPNTARGWCVGFGM
ncbi:armadillo-type protein [Lipomyces arxii]|uniref:armadillo-type protein n=1 Tax=Lipomyces arxii TaxID=56418 RepID=UPI0034CD1845